MPRKSRKVLEIEQKLGNSETKTLDRRGESINTTDIPEDAATIKKNADKQVTYSYRHVSTDSNS